jgi:hypothetical protein
MVRLVGVSSGARGGVGVVGFRVHEGVLLAIVRDSFVVGADGVFLRFYSVIIGIGGRGGAGLRGAGRSSNLKGVNIEVSVQVFRGPLGR